MSFRFAISISQNIREAVFWQNIRNFLRVFVSWSIKIFSQIRLKSFISWNIKNFYFNFILTLEPRSSIFWNTRSIFCGRFFYFFEPGLKNVREGGLFWENIKKTFFWKNTRNFFRAGFLGNFLGKNLLRTFSWYFINVKMCVDFSIIRFYFSF